MRDLDSQITGLLADGEVWTAISLAERLGVSLRTIRRAIARLHSDGLGMDSEPGRGGGLRLTRRAGIPRLSLHYQESVDLLLALAVAESLSFPVLGNHLKPIRRKLAMAFPAGEREKLGRLRKRILVGRPATSAVCATLQTPTAVEMAPVQAAFIESRELSFSYVDSQAHVTQRLIEPQFFLLNYPAWYLLAYDTGRKAGRCFRLDRIRGAESHNTSFNPRAADTLTVGVDHWFERL